MFLLRVYKSYNIGGPALLPYNGQEVTPSLSTPTTDKRAPEKLIGIDSSPPYANSVGRLTIPFLNMTHRMCYSRQDRTYISYTCIVMDLTYYITLYTAIAIVITFLHIGI